MNYTVGVFAADNIKDEAILEAKKALQEISKKYQCRFELKEETFSTGKTGKTALVERLEEGVKGKISNGLSFGGEIDL